MQIRGHFLKAEFYVSQNKVPLDFQNSHFWGRGGGFVLFFTRTRIENAKWTRIANPRPLYYATFLRLQNKIFSDFGNFHLWGRGGRFVVFFTLTRIENANWDTRTGIENGKWPRNAIPRACLLTKLFTFTKQIFFGFSKFSKLRPLGPFCQFGHANGRERASKMANGPEMQFRDHFIIPKFYVY